MDKIKEFFNDGKTAMAELKSKKWYRQIPNILTFSRLFAPIVVLALTLFSNITACIIALSAFAFTDCLDGVIARKFNLKSNFGAKLDTIADKVFAFTLMIPLVLSNPVLLVNMLLEVRIAFVNMMSYFKGNEPKSTILGKGKTVLLYLTLIVGYLSSFVALSNTLIAGLISLTAIAQIASSISYNKIDKEKDMKKEIQNIIEKINDEENIENNVVEKGLIKEIEYNNNFPTDDLKPKTKQLKR